MNALKVRVPLAYRDDFGCRPFVGTHNLQRNDLFSDASLAALLDVFPRQQLYAQTMGSDLTRPGDHRLALHDGVSGADLLRAVRKGRLWLNITRVDGVDTQYRALVDQLYGQLAARIPGFAPTGSHGTLLISSPHALVYYHADGPASALWHIRGHKRIWVYPALDNRYVQRELLEDIFAGVRHEYLPYRREFDRAAIAYDLAPGHWATWPQNAPHRVTNQADLNVSLATEYYTSATQRRQQVYLANRFFRTRLHVRQLSQQETGVRAFLKTVVHRSAHRIGLDPLPLRRHEPSFRVDPDAPGGIIPLADARSGSAVDAA